MSNICSKRSAFADRVCRLKVSDESGQSTSEYGVTVLIAMALALSILALFTGGAFDPILHGLMSKALTTAEGMIH